MNRLLLPLVVISSKLTALAEGPPASAVPWQADRGDGTYQNPILHADYSDPDAVRVGADYWMTSSSFSHVPGLPLLHSRDLVNWELVGHALPRLMPEEVFRTPQHGKGVWAPSIRHHGGKFWIYYPDPDFGIYVITAENPRGPWSAPTLVKGGKGLIDPCPYWDASGEVYLVHAWARSRAGIANRLQLLRLSADGRRAEEDLGMIIDGDKIPVEGFRTLEGPKFYHRNGWYYIFAPAGGVEHGWQSVFRSRTITGPYEHKIVLAQGKTPVNGPHQGALVDTPQGDWWFLHFQDKGAYGRIVHLQPVVWKNDWPVIGEDPDGDGTGQPVLTHRKPALPAAEISVPPTSDEFERKTLGVQWQWQANFSADWASLSERPGFLRLRAPTDSDVANLYNAPHLLLQKFPAESFTATTKLELPSDTSGDLRSGLIVFGYDYAWLGLRRKAGKTELVYATRRQADKGEPEAAVPLVSVENSSTVWLRVEMQAGARCKFAYSLDGKQFTPVGGEEFTATQARWVGGKVGLFATGTGTADFEGFSISKP